jgi:hypothetical protein
MLLPLTFGCSDTPHHLAAVASATPSVATAPVPTADAQASRVLAAAITATAALRSYTFVSTQILTSTRAVRSTLSGAAVRPSSVTYTLAAGGKRTQVVRLPTATYLRVLPARWSKLRKPGRSLDPLTSLLALLRSLQDPRTTPGSRDTGLRAVVPASAAAAGGLPVGSAAAVIRLTFDAGHRVTSATINTTVSRTGQRPVQVSLSTHYGTFNKVSALRAPV